MDQENKGITDVKKSELIKRIKELIKMINDLIKMINDLGNKGLSNDFTFHILISGLEDKEIDQLEAIIKKLLILINQHKNQFQIKHKKQESSQKGSEKQGTGNILKQKTQSNKQTKKRRK